MPAPAILLSRRRVLRAVEQALFLHSRCAHVAADTFADVFDSTLRDLGRQKRIGNGRTGCTDNVALAAVDGFDHVIGIGEPAVANDWNRAADNTLYILNKGAHPVRLTEAGTAGVFAPLFVVADLQRPEIHHSFLVHKLHEADAVLEVLYAVVSVHRIGLETDGYAKPVTDGLFQGRHELDEETRSIFQRTAVLIIATVVALFEELHWQAVVPAGNLNEIETRLLGAFGGQHIHPDEGLNIALIGNGGIDVALGKNIRRQPTGRSGNLSRLKPRSV